MVPVLVDTHHTSATTFCIHLKLIGHKLNPKSFYYAHLMQQLMTINQKIISILRFSTLENWRFQLQKLTEKFVLVTCHYRPCSQPRKRAYSQ